jgi:hypothetical protein
MYIHMCMLGSRNLYCCVDMIFFFFNFKKEKIFLLAKNTIKFYNKN